MRRTTWFGGGIRVGPGQGQDDLIFGEKGGLAAAFGIILHPLVHLPRFSMKEGRRPKSVVTDSFWAGSVPAGGAARVWPASVFGGVATIRPGNRWNQKSQTQNGADASAVPVDILAAFP